MWDVATEDSYSRNEVIRCIHIGLSCVQEDPIQRPTIQSIIVTLNSQSISLSDPQEPAYFRGNKTDSNMAAQDHHCDQSTSKSMQWSVDDATISELHLR